MRRHQIDWLEEVFVKQDLILVILPPSDVNSFDCLVIKTAVIKMVNISTDHQTEVILPIVVNTIVQRLAKWILKKGRKG